MPESERSAAPDDETVVMPGLDATDIGPATSSDALVGMASGGNKGRIHRFEAWLDRASDRLNPILVKESRQALKSRQFAVTFSFLLVLALGWTFFAVALHTPAIYYAPLGKYVLAGYFWILLFPLVVIVPFSAFRSLAMEREDGTYELLTITSLQAHKIVSGKLGSAILQMTVYLSALAPCIAFTYLLRGVDLGFILIAIFGAFMVSVLFSAIGLVTATLANARHLQVILSVVLILGLAIAFIWIGIVAMGVMFGGFVVSVADPAVLDSIGCFATAWACAVALAYLAAAAQVQFLSDNRSTPLRIAMVVSTLCMIGWATWYGARWDDLQDAAEAILVLGWMFWSVMGAFMVGERPDLSPRVRRNLPKTFLGRVCLTWFQPGPGSGYFFALTNMLMCAFIAVGLSLSAGQIRDIDWTIAAATVSVCYLAAYVGLGRLLVMALRHRQVEGPLLSFILHIVLVAFGVVVPLVVQWSMHGSTTYAYGSGYTALQIPNPFWTFDAGINGGPTFQNGWYVSTVVLVEAAVVMVLINLVLLAGGLMPVRESVPKRVADDR